MLDVDDGVLGGVAQRLRPARLLSPPHVLAPRALHDLHADDLPLAVERTAHRHVVGALRTPAARHVVHLAVAGAEEVVGERVEDVVAVHHVALADRDVERHQLVVVGRGDVQRLLQRVDEVAELRQRHVLRRLLVVPLPDLVVHVEVVLRQALLDVLRRLAEVLEDHRDVHVDDDEETDDEVTDEEHQAEGDGAAVALRQRRRLVQRAVLRVADAGQHAVPARRRRHLEQQDHAVQERLEVEQVVDAVHVLDVHEEVHAEDGEDEHDEEEEQADVDEGGKRDGEGEEERADALGRLDEAQDAPDAEDAHDAQQGGGEEEVLHQVSQPDRCNTPLNTDTQHSAGLKADHPLSDWLRKCVVWN